MTRVKICGINDAASFDACVAAAVDWIGFNFYPGSPRYVTPGQAASLSARSAGGPRRVGLFVEPSVAQITQALDDIPLDVLQLYADADRVGEIRARFARPVWRSIGVRTAIDLPHSADGVDGFVIEAPAAPGTRPGGNARRFDWSLLGGWQAPAPWLLAGGLSPANVRAAIAGTSAPGVDVSSGVERAPGQKDVRLIAEFVARARDHA
jgi:phosphoribosylanthranilate isomerase